MDSNQTLHDFVLTLITNPEARSAFQLDPEGTLDQAGLGDITAADVQDVIPLVVDYTAVPGNGELAPAAEPDLGAADGGPAGVIGQLQAITQQLALAGQPASVEGNLAAAGAIAVDAGNLGLALTAPGGVGLGADPSGVSADLSGANDVAATLDYDLVGPVATDATGTVGHTADSAVGTADDLTAGLPDGLTGGPLDDVLDTAGSVGDGLTGPLGGPSLPVDVPELGVGGSAAGQVTGTVDETLDGVGGGLLDSGASSSQGGAGSGLLDDATDILF